MNAVEPVVVVKKKQGHGQHHGGAWKVAYADFVTAMMALFIVLWLMSTSQEVQKSIAGYFRDPKGFGKQTGSNMSGNGESLAISKDKMDLLKGKIEQAIKKSPDFSKLKDNIEMTVTGEGLRIELLENEKGMFFETGQPLPTEAGKDLLTTLAKEVGKLPNPLLIEGHTDAKPFQKSDYGNWELSADRANAARRIMEEDGLRPGQVQQVRGFADQRLRLPDDPGNPRNRRISIIIQFPQAAPEPAPTDASPSDAAKVASANHAPKH